MRMSGLILGLLVLLSLTPAMAQTNRPGSYGIPSYEAKHVEAWVGYLDKMNQQLHPKWVTFVPTWLVRPGKTREVENSPHGKHVDVTLGSIETDRVPKEPLLKAVRHAVLDLGLCVAFQPHIDLPQNLADTKEYKDTGIPTKWRNHIIFSPFDAEYETKIIRFLFDVIVQVDHEARKRTGTTPPCWALTFGSEVDKALFVHTEDWIKLAKMYDEKRSKAGLKSRLLFGHKVNHDVSSVYVDFTTFKLDKSTVEKRLGLYIDLLDYVEVSFYPQGTPKPPDGWDKHTQANVDHVAKSFTKKLNTLNKYLNDLKKAHGAKRDKSDAVCLTAGEFGLGSANTNSPEEVKAETLLGTDGKITAGNQQKRRLWYAALFNAFAKLPACKGRAVTCPPAVTAWTTGPQYDTVNVFFTEDKFKVYVDPELIKLFQEYYKVKPRFGGFFVPRQLNPGTYRVVLDLPGSVDGREQFLSQSLSLDEVVPYLGKLHPAVYSLPNAKPSVTDELRDAFSGVALHLYDHRDTAEVTVPEIFPIVLDGGTASSLYDLECTWDMFGLLCFGHGDVWCELPQEGEPICSHEETDDAELYIDAGHLVVSQTDVHIGITPDGGLSIRTPDADY